MEAPRLAAMPSPMEAPRLAQLEAFALRASAHIRSGGAYFTSIQRCSVANEAVACLGQFNSCGAMEEMKAFSPDCNLEPNLVTAIHLIVNLQNEITVRKVGFFHAAVAAHICSIPSWQASSYKRKIVSAAAAYAGCSAALSEDDQEGAAMELLAVVAFAVALAVVELGIGKAPSEHEALRGAEGGPLPECRATACATVITRDVKLGHGPFVSKSRLKPSVDAPPAAKAAVEAAIDAAGKMAFSVMLPLKALSAGCMHDYAFSLALMEALYVPAAKFTDLKYFRCRRGLRSRAQVELVAETYSAARECAF